MHKKKLFKSLSLLTLACTSTSIYAAAAAPFNNNVRLTLPHSNPGFEINLAALWLKPGASNLNYAILNKELPAQSPGWTEQEIKPSYSPGFELGVRYMFPNSGDKDINLDWTHLYSNTSTSVTVPNYQYFIGPDFEIGPDSIPGHKATGQATFRYDVVNLDVGQYVHFGQNLEMRVFAGLSNGYLREEVVSTFTGTTVGAFPGPFSMMQDVMSRFTGIGPRVGVSGDYTFNCGFGLLGEAAASTLIGSLNAKSQYAGSAAEVLALYGETVNRQIISDQTVYQVIPGLDAKLGVSYKHPFGNGGLFTVSAGYQAAVYVNAISQYVPGTLVAGEGIETGGIFVATMNHTLSNYSVQGPFLNFALQF